MTGTKRERGTNRLLDQLPRLYRERFLAGCEVVDLTRGKILAVPGNILRHVFFPTESFISLTTRMGRTASLEVALVGNEGVLGTPLALGVGAEQLLAVVAGGGWAWRMSAGRFRRELAGSLSLRRTVQHYVAVRMEQLAQVVACTRFHVVEQRLARWLLMIADRTHSETFHMTHELLARALGVRRVGVTKAATALQERKLIRYSRGDIAILDRHGLEAASCGCYRADRKTYGRVMEE